MAIKHSILTLSLLVSCAAQAKQKTPSMFITDFPKVIVGLDCPGVAALQLKEVVEWRKAGVQLPPDLTGLRARADAVSSTAAFLVFSDDGETDSLKNAEFADGGSIDRLSVGLPDHLLGCAVVPLAMDAREMRSGAPMLVDKVAYNRLGALDRFVFRDWLRGFSVVAVGALVNPAAQSGSLADRFNFNKSHLLPTLNTSQAEIVIDDNPDYQPVNGVLRSGQSVTAPGIGITFADNGKIRRVITDHGDGAYVATIASVGGEVLPKGGAGDTLYCKDQALYRTDGTLAICGGQFFSPDGKPNVDEKFRGYAFATGNSDTHLDNPTDPIGVYDESGKGGTVIITTDSTSFSGMTVLSGEPSCASLSVNTTKPHEADFSVPADCIALVQLQVPPPPPSKPAAPVAVPHKASPPPKHKK